MISFSELEETTKIYLVIASGIVSMLVSTLPFLSNVQSAIASYQENSNQFRWRDIAKPLLWQLAWTIGFVSAIGLIDLGNKMNFAFGGLNGAIAQFWSNDYLSLLDSVDPSSKQGVAYGSALITKLLYPIGIVFMFFTYTYPFLDNALEHRKREMQNNNLSPNWVVYAFTILYVIGGCGTYFVAYSGIVSYSMYHDGAFVPYEALGGMFMEMVRGAVSEG